MILFCIFLLCPTLGPKVISKEITIESIQELSEVLHRPPLIWDNLHANDYDQKRLFLGPYCGRSTELIPRLRGVLTNPNCEYETNFVPIHTLSQWRKCTIDGKRELNLSKWKVSLSQVLIVKKLKNWHFNLYTLNIVTTDSLSASIY